MSTKAQGRATIKYRAKAYDRIDIQIPKGSRELLHRYAEQRGESLQGWIKRLIATDIGEQSLTELVKNQDRKA